MNKKGIYTKKVLKYFRNPRNYGKMKNPDGIGRVGNPTCGDIMYLYIKIGKNKKGEEVLRDIKFETFGCVAAIATSSAITDLAKGKTLKEALKIERGNIVDSLGGLPPIKIHCSVLAAGALSEAIYDYLSKNKREIPKELKARHDQAEREKKEIEKRHKGWVELEEEAYKKKR